MFDIIWCRAPQSSSFNMTSRPPGTGGSRADIGGAVTEHPEVPVLCPGHSPGTVNRPDFPRLQSEAALINLFIWVNQ